MTRQTELSSLESSSRLFARLQYRTMCRTPLLWSFTGAEVTVAEWVVLRELYNSGSAPSALADRLGMTRGAISKLADRLIAKEMIVRRAKSRRPPVPVTGAHPAGTRNHAKARGFGG